MHWYKKCTEKGLSQTHATTLTAFINQFEKCLKDHETVNGDKSSQIAEKDLVNTLGESLKFFDDVVVREQIFRLNLQRVQLKEEIT